MDLTYQVTFENNAGNPVVVKGRVSASNVATCAARALKDAKKQAKHVHWTSVVVLLEKPQETV